MPRVASFALAPCLVALALPGLARAGGAEDKLGDAYKNANPAEKLAMLCVASTDKTLDHSKEVSPAVEEVVRAVLKGGETSEARLKLLGQLRTDAQEKVKAINEERKGKPEKPRSVSFIEPDSYSQQAVILEYVGDAAGPAPGLDKLKCLKLVRDCTSWMANGSLVHAFLAESLNRDEKYRAADLEGKLGIIRDLSVDELMSDHERTSLEKPLVGEWMMARLKAGDAPDALLGELKKWKGKSLTCFFTQSWAESMLKRLGEHRGSRG